MKIFSVWQMVDEHEYFDALAPRSNPIDGPDQYTLRVGPAFIERAVAVAQANGDRAAGFLALDVAIRPAMVLKPSDDLGETFRGEPKKSAASLMIES